ncbi:helix-turn-helix domain-containing protein [Nitrospirillum sp. BR 11163]|uniref:AlbA family DNA-binding domain-containing protein n=1 Tax=Nitrospirillum sp. BR 11163 TaxID=3104323 RepID=UPI002AFF1FE9|nr:RNA-binding domain-containing protein [Nitrospirillum sp. BR 11163]MEA1677100.1 putative DNA binding domain-containing protein [Nitrospirillum sp. BR 11163]
MALLDAETLLALFRDLEADNVERTSAATDKSKIGRAICAFANDLADRRQPGVLFIGQKDDGSCAGLDITDEILKIFRPFDPMEIFSPFHN